MRKNIVSILLAFMLLCSMFLCCCAVEPTNEIKNVILMIGDGMGYSNIEASRYVCFENPSEQKFVMEQLTYTVNVRTASITTYLSEGQTQPTDSAAAGTALATGVKTMNGSVALDKDGGFLVTLMEAARDKGYKTGVVTTKTTTDATPAAFSAHNGRRHDPGVLLSDQIELGLNVLVGNYPMDGTKMDSDFAYIRSKGYSIVRTKDEFVNTTGDVVGFIDDIRSTHEEGQFVAVVEKTLNLLIDDNGFVVMIEGGAIDSYAHENNLAEMAAQLWEFDLAVAKAKEFVDANPDTLLIVTADHQTGGIVMPENPTKQNVTDDVFTCETHNIDDVPMFLYGKCADELAGLVGQDNAIENVMIPRYIASKWELWSLQANWANLDEGEWY